MQSAVGQNGNGRRSHGDRGVTGGELYLHLFRMARASAMRHGLPDREIEDCAIEFVTRMLRYDRRDHWPHEPGPGREAWLRECADNWVRTVRRRLARISCREVFWTETVTGEGLEGSGALCSHVASPEAQLLEKELHGRIMDAVGRLTPAQQELFDGYFCMGESVPDLVERTGRTPQAVRRALTTIRQRLRQVLERQALDETEAREYLSVVRPSPALRHPRPAEEIG
jgi:RNA polymerase sigma factor (sigma-70 family)